LRFGGKTKSNRFASNIKREKKRAPLERERFEEETGSPSAGSVYKKEETEGTTSIRKRIRLPDFKFQKNKANQGLTWGGKKSASDR